MFNLEPKQQVLEHTVNKLCGHKTVLGNGSRPAIVDAM